MMRTLSVGTQLSRCFDLEPVCEAIWNRLEPVDLMGRLSNPADSLETLAAQGVASAGDVHEQASESISGSSRTSRPCRHEETGQLSNPGRAIQRRLTGADIDALVTEYRAGRTLTELADAFGVHRRTVATQLARRGVQRRVNVRKMSDDDIREASRRYRAGDSLAIVAQTLSVHAETVRRALVRAGVKIRPRPGF